MKTHPNVSPAEGRQPKQGRLAQWIGKLANQNQERKAYYDLMLGDGSIPGSMDNIRNLIDEIGTNGAPDGTFLEPDKAYKDNFRRKTPLVVSKAREDGTMSRLLDVFFVGHSALGLVAHEGRNGGPYNTEAIELVVLPFGQNRQNERSDSLNMTPQTIFDERTVNLRPVHNVQNPNDPDQTIVLGRVEIGDTTVSDDQMEFTFSRDGKYTFTDLDSINGTVHIDTSTVAMNNDRSLALKGFVDHLEAFPQTWDTAFAETPAPVQ